MPGASSTHPYTSDMAAVHQVYRSSFASVPEYIEGAVGDADRRDLIANYYTNVLASLEAHHGGKNVHLFPLLIERAPEQSELVNLAVEEHEQVLPLMAEANAAVTTWGSKPSSGALGGDA